MMSKKISYKRGDVVLALFPNSSPTFHASGLLSNSVVMTDNLATITTKALERIIGQLPMKEVDKALRHTLDL